MARPNSAFEAGNKYQPAVGAFEYIGLGALDDLLHGLVGVATWELSERLGLGGFEDPFPSETNTFQIFNCPGSQGGGGGKSATPRAPGRGPEPPGRGTRPGGRTGPGAGRP